MNPYKDDQQKSEDNNSSIKNDSGQLQPLEDLEADRPKANISPYTARSNQRLTR